MWLRIAVTAVAFAGLSFVALAAIFAESVILEETLPDRGIVVHTLEAGLRIVLLITPLFLTWLTWRHTKSYSE